MRILRLECAILRLAVEYTGEESDGMSSVVAPFERICAHEWDRKRGRDRWES